MSRSDPPPSGTVERRADDDVFRLRAARDAALQAARTALHDTTRLTRVLSILSEPAPLECLLDRTLATLSELFAADIVILLDPAGTGTLRPLAAIGLPEDAIGLPISDAHGGYVSAAMSAKAPVLTQAARTDPLVDPHLRELGTETLVWLPVIGNHAVRGAMILARCRPEPFSQTDVALLTVMAYRIGLALEQAQHGVQIEQIVRVGRDIIRKLDRSAIYADVVAGFPIIVQADAAALILGDARGTLRCVAQSGLDPAGAPQWCRLAEHLRLDPCIAAGNARSIQDLHEASRRHGVELPTSCLVRTVLAVPIIREDRSYGLLFAMRFSTTAFSPDVLQVTALYAAQISAALESARLYEALQDELRERVRIDQALQASHERFRALISSVSDVIAIVNADGTMRYASPAAGRVWEVQPDALLGHDLLSRVHPDDCEAMRRSMSRLRERPNSTLTHALRMRRGHDTWRDFEVILTNLLDEPAVAGIVATYHDVTERKTYEQELTALAFRDPLTGLANRGYFMTCLRNALAKADAELRSIGVVFFDLDNFKVVNDSLGHEWGDQVLRVVASRIRAGLRNEDVAARLGGDEFTLLIDDATSLDHVIRQVERLIASLRDPIQLEGRDRFVGVSAGIAISNPKHDSADDLLRKADLAMYQAKTNGKGYYAIFDSQLNAAAQHRLELETDLHQACKRQELEVAYQPIVALSDRRVCGIEALLRWHHPRRGLIAPSEFIPVAEETGLIFELGQWVLEQACEQARRWNADYPACSPLLLSVNISARQFRRPTLVEEIRAALRASELEPQCLMLEITEGSLVHDRDGTIAALWGLRDIGVRLAIDDFGTGYSGLSYLKKLPIDTLKIDCSFVSDIEADPHDRAIVQSVVALAAAFDLNVIAEGIETEQQATYLRTLGCPRGQGYLFAPALAPDALAAMLQGDAQVRARHECQAGSDDGTSELQCFIE